MDGDGKPDLEIYETTATSQCDKKKLDKDIYLSNGTSGYIIGFPKSYLWQRLEERLLMAYPC